MFNLGGQGLLMFLLGAAVPVVAYFAKRRIEGRPFLDRLERRSKALALHREMKSEGLTVEDIDALETDLTASRRKRIEQIEDSIAAELAEQRAPEPLPGETQAELNVLAQADLDISRAMLAKALRQLEMYPHAEASETLQTAQRRWKKYAEAEARWIASECEGGSLYPLIYLAALDRLTTSRIAEVRLQIEQARERYVIA